MLPYTFSKLQTYLEGGSIFTHTKIDNAKIRLQCRIKENPEKVNVAVFGDEGVIHAKLVCTSLISILNKLGAKEELAFVVGDFNRTDKIVKKFADISNIETYVIKCATEDNWLSESTPYQTMVDSVINMADVVIFFSSKLKGRSMLEYAYNLATLEGCFVIKRIIKGQ